MSVGTKVVLKCESLSLDVMVYSHLHPSEVVYLLARCSHWDSALNGRSVFHPQNGYSMLSDEVCARVGGAHVKKVPWQRSGNC